MSLIPGSDLWPVCRISARYQWLLLIASFGYFQCSYYELSYCQFGYREFGYHEFDYREFGYHGFDYREFDYHEFGYYKFDHDQLLLLATLGGYHS